VADIFLSYSKSDEPDARLLSAFLESQGYSVWWDSDLGGGDKFRRTIISELTKAGAVVVIWTQNSVVSDWVQSEAGRAFRDQKLIPVRSAGVEYKDIPPPFDNVHTLKLGDREQIVAAVSRQLAKPATPSPLWKILRFELLSWLGVLGGAITLITNINGLIKLSNLFHWLFANWSALLKFIWQALLLFKFEISAYDATLLTIGALITSGIFYSSTRQQSITVRRPARALFLPLFLILCIIIIGVFNISARERAKSLRRFDSQVEQIFANRPECVNFTKALFHNPKFGLEIVNIIKGDSRLDWRDCFKSAGAKAELKKLLDLSMSNKEEDKSVWFGAVNAKAELKKLLDPSMSNKEEDKSVGFGAGIVIAGYLSPVVLPFVLYWAMSLVLPIKLQVSILQRRLWRTLIVFAGIIVVNYVAVGIEAGIPLLKSMVDLN
jgi:hypothetical protein